MSCVIARRVFLVLIGWIWAISAHAQPATTDMTAASVAGVAAIVVDGELNDEAWQQAVPVTAFVQRDPLEGAAPSFRTEARVIYDSSAIYIAVRAFDTDPASRRVRKPAMRAGSLSNARTPM